MNIKKTERKINEVEDVADKNNDLLKVAMQQMQSMYNYKIANINESLNKDFWKYHETKQYINNLVGNESNLINDRIDRLS